MSAKFDLRSLQSSSVDLPSLEELQCHMRAPSLQDMQMDRPELPSLSSFQSDEDMERSPSLKVLQV